MTGHTGKLVEKRAADSGRAYEFGSLGSFGSDLESHQVGRQVCRLLASGLGVLHEARHIGIGSDGRGISDPAGQPISLKSISGEP